MKEYTKYVRKELDMIAQYIFYMQAAACSWGNPQGISVAETKKEFAEYQRILETAERYGAELPQVCRLFLEDKEAVCAEIQQNLNEASAAYNAEMRRMIREQGARNAIALYS